MKHSSLALIFSAALLQVDPAATAQTGGENGVHHRRLAIQEAAAPGGARHVTSELAGEMLISLKTVKGAPYSAETEGETVQTLADGNRIIRRNKSRVYRDSEGRTRHEYSFAQTEGAKAAGIISIHDPVAGVAYTLHPAIRTAESIIYSGTSSASPESAAVWRSDDNTQFFIRKAPSPETLPHMTMQPGTESRILLHVTEPARTQKDYTSESLGKRFMEGVEVEGTRTSVTLAAGAIGNQLPIVTTTETWFSPELQTIIYSRREDPLSGTTTFKVTNLVRGEPDATLFQLPAEYSVSEEGLPHKIHSLPKK